MLVAYLTLANNQFCKGSGVYSAVWGFPIWEARGSIDETAELSRHQDYERQARHAMQVPSRPPGCLGHDDRSWNRGREHFFTGQGALLPR